MKPKEIKFAKLSKLSMVQAKIDYPELTKSQIAEAFKRACKKNPINPSKSEFYDELWYESANVRYPEISIEQIREIGEDIREHHSVTSESSTYGEMEPIFCTKWARIHFPDVPEKEIKKVLYSTEGIVMRGKVYSNTYMGNRNSLKDAFVKNLNKRIKYLESSNVLGERIRKEILEKDYEPLAVFGGVELFMRLKGLNPNDFGIQKETTEIRQKIADWVCPKYDIEDLDTKVRNEFVNDNLIERNYPTQEGQKIFDEIGIEVIRNPEKFKKIISQVAEIESKINEIL